MPHTADEVVAACCALWDCWQDDALVMDKESGLFIDPEKVRYADYEGRHVRTRGPLTIPRSPQGRPVLMQAGSSPRGRDFAARWRSSAPRAPRKTRSNSTPTSKGGWPGSAARRMIA